MTGCSSVKHVVLSVELETPISLITISKLQGIVLAAEQYALNIMERPRVHGNTFTIYYLPEDQLWGFGHQAAYAACFWGKFSSYLLQTRSSVLTSVSCLSM